MSYTIKNLKEHWLSDTNKIGYSAELVDENGRCILVEISESESKECIVHNKHNDAVYPIEGTLPLPKRLSDYRDGDKIILGPCIRESNKQWFTHNMKSILLKE